MRENNKLDIVTYINNEIENNIIKQGLIINGEKIVVAVSGGPDSMCLLTSFLELKEKFQKIYNISYDICVAHVNHMIRQESKDEKIYVENYCKKYNVPFYYLEEDVPNNSKKYKMSEESYGRKIRYEFFNKVLLETSSTKIATAHNLDDDVETILLNMIRGCGLNGLTGMNFTYKNIIRPMLTIKKEDILKYNDVKKLNPAIDITNFSTIYSRNKIRNILIPTLKEQYNPNILESIIRMKNILTQDENFLENYTKNIVEKMIIENEEQKIKFDFSLILDEHISIKQRVIRYIINMKLGNLDGVESIHINDILKLFKSNIKGKKYIIGNKFEIDIIKKNIAIIY